jgi:transglutaminase-like putative cysteine protease
MKKIDNTSSVTIIKQKPDADNLGTKMVLLCELFLCLSLYGGSWFSLLSMVDIVFIKWILFPVILLSPIILYLLFKKMNAPIVFIYLLLPAAAFYVIKLNAVWDGYLLIANSIIERLNQLGFSVIPFATSGVDAAVHVTMALTPLCILSAAVIVFGVIKRHAIPTVVFAILPPLLGVALRIEPERLPLLLLVLGCVCFFAFCVAGSDNRSPEPRQAWRIPGITTIILSASVVVLCFLVLTWLFPAKRYVPSLKTELLKEQLIASADALRYENANSGTIYRLPFGDLKNASPAMYTENTALRVTMEKPRPLYLRTFTGSTYHHGKWGGLPPDAYSGDYTGIFLWLQYNNFYPQIQLGSYLALLEEAQTGRVTIDNIALSSKYIFAPYEALPGLSLGSESARFEKDDLILGKGLRGTRQYFFDACLPPVEDYAGTDQTALQLDSIKNTPEYKKFTDSEKVYRNFVYNRYLHVPPEEGKLLRDYFSEAALDTMKDSDRRVVVNMIRKYFSESFSYSLEVSPLLADANFLEGFLRDREGYEIHFATLATLLLREAGIPARYVEGYYLSAQEIDIYTEMKSVTFDLPDSSAHAWTEVYEDGIGWLPVEVTPGFYTLTKDQEDNCGKKDILADNPKYLFLKDKNAVIDPIITPPKDDPGGFSRQLLLIPLALFILLAAILLWRQWYKKKIKRALTQQDSRKATLYIYRCLIRLLRFDGVKTDDLTADHVLRQANEKYPHPPGIAMESILGYIYRARFAAEGRDIKKDELASMSSFLHFLAEEIYQGKKIHHKALMIFLCLRYPHFYQ